MAIYYVDPLNGSPANNGLSADTPIKTNVGLNVQPGDTVLFKRGSLIRGALHNVNGEEGRPVTYGAYGEGANPIFSGSVDVSAPECWQKYEGMDNVWRCVGALDACVGNFVFDQKEGGAFRWEKNELSEQGDWYDSAADKIETEMSAQEHEVLMYSAGNPGEVYDHIECAQCKHRALAKTGHDLIIENLTFQNNGLHGIATGMHNKNMIVRGCRFEFIGGSVWSKELKIRFGNAVEFWTTAENILVERCVFYDIYDSAVTHQGPGEKCDCARNLAFKHNIFLRCGMAAYEQRDKLPLSGEFSGNVCADAGRGFSHKGETLPRKSEIWPAPMGHHIFLWRIEQPTPGAKFEIRDNVFMNAYAGAAIYSVNCPEADAQTVIDDNKYCLSERVLLARIGGHDYNDFDEYVRATGKDTHSLCADL